MKTYKELTEGKFTNDTSDVLGIAVALNILDTLKVTLENTTSDFEFPTKNKFFMKFMNKAYIKKLKDFEKDLHQFIKDTDSATKELDKK